MWCYIELWNVRSQTVILSIAILQKRRPCVEVSFCAGLTLPWSQADRRLSEPWFSCEAAVPQQPLLLLLATWSGSLFAAGLPMLQHQGSVRYCEGLCRNSLKGNVPTGILEVSLERCSGTGLVAVVLVDPGFWLPPCHCPISTHLAFTKRPLPTGDFRVSGLIDPKIAVIMTMSRTHKKSSILMWVERAN